MAPKDRIIRLLLNLIFTWLTRYHGVIRQTRDAGSDMSPFDFVIFMTYFFTALVPLVAGSLEQKLHDELLHNYNPTIRPLTDSTKAINVTLYPWITYMHVDEPREELHYLQWLQIMWNDEYLRWDPSKFKNMSRIAIRTDLIWIPEIAPMTLTMRHEIFEKNRAQAQVDFEGNVLLYKSETISINCNFSMEDFPFEVTTCLLPYQAIGLTSDQVVLETLRFTEQQMVDSIELSPEFELLSFSPRKTRIASIERGSTKITIGDYLDNSKGNQVTGEGEKLDFIVYTLIFKRKPKYYFYVFIGPGMMVTATCILGLFSPFNTSGEREEKVNLGLATLLALAIMLQLVADSVPKGTDDLPALGKYILNEVALTTVGTIVTVLITYCHKYALKRGKGPPKWLCKLCFVNHNTMVKEEKLFKKNKKVVGLGKDETKKNLTAMMKSCLEKLEQIKEKLDETSSESNEAWNRIFDRVDLFFLIAFSIALAANMIYLLAIYAKQMNT